MRRKKHKHTRRSMAFYRVHFGFREPFKVLLDGNFLHATLAANMTNLQGLMETLLGGTCKLFTTKCAGAELRALGRDFAPAGAAARGHALHKCGHEPPLDSGADCILSQASAANAARWVVATQDKGLQAALSKVPGAPVVFASVNGLHLSEPSDTARSLAASGAAAAQALPLHERASEALRDLHELRPKDEWYKKFRRRHTKGPNPLAVKKKAKGGAPAPAAAGAKDAGRGAAAAAGGGGGSGGEGEGAAARRKRKRKKAKGGGSGGEGAGGGEGGGGGGGSD